jgi:large subunit ribosomal protein L9
MQVILLEDVKGSGKKGDIVNASDGHAKNFLIPRKLAAEATKENIAKLEGQKKKAAQKLDSDIAAAKAIAEKLSDAKIKIPVKVGDGGKMYGSISNKELAESLLSQAGVTIDKKKIQMPAAKNTGEHKATIKLHTQVSVTITFELVAA